MSSKLNRNDLCHCGSGKKYKNCHFEKDKVGTKSALMRYGIVTILFIGLLIVAISYFKGDSGIECPSGMTWSAAHQHCH